MFEDIIGKPDYECPFCGTIYPPDEYFSCPSCDRARVQPKYKFDLHPECKDCTVKGLWCGSCF
jgi:hypothetical protein